MEPRVAFSRVAPEALQILLEMEKYLWASTMDECLLELVRIRVSQMNGCAYCLEMHTKVARAAGEPEEKLHLLSVWQDAQHLFTPQECAALEFAEKMTLARPKVLDAQNAKGTRNDAYAEIPQYTHRTGSPEDIRNAESVQAVHSLCVPDETYARLEKYFSVSEIADLTWVIIAINHWNRLAISLHGFDQGTIRAIYRAKKQVASREK